MNAALIAELDALLPQTQCTKCGFEGCGPYAEALASAGRADINRCPPGGDTGVRRLAALLGRRYRPLDPQCGIEQPRRVAFIDEPQCIGCTLCIQACPVDAILGAPKQMHTVLTDLCSGCDLCVASCPVDCIAMLPSAGTDAVWDIARARAARQRFEARRLRLRRETSPDELEREQRPAGGAAEKLARAESDKRAAIQAAIERASARRAAVDGAVIPRQRKSS